MGRFHADTADERTELFADALSELQLRQDSFLTLEATSGSEDQPPWIQYRDGTVNLDCAPAEYERLSAAVANRGDVTVASVTRPETAEGTNVKLDVRGDPGRIAETLESWFREVYDMPSEYRAWVTAI